MAIDPTDQNIALRAARLRRTRRLSLVIGSLVSVLLVLGLRRCL